MFKNQPGLIPTATDADTSGYSDLQKKAVAIVSEAQKITQYFDRDTRSDFAGANGAQSLLQKFLANPTQDLAAYQKSIQDFWDQLPPLDLTTRILTPCQGRSSAYDRPPRRSPRPVGRTLLRRAARAATRC